MKKKFYKVSFYVEASDPHNALLYIRGLPAVQDVSVHEGERQVIYFPNHLDMKAETYSFADRFLSRTEITPEE